MKKRSQFSKLWVFTMISVTLMAFSGCTPARKPVPSPSPAPKVIPERHYSPTKNNPAGTVEEANGLNNKLSAAVDKIPGIKKATVIVIGTSAYAGLNLEDNLSKARLEALRPRVESAIKNTEPRIRSVWTATHPKTVRKIDQVRGHLRAKRPSSSYSAILRDIINESDLVRHQG